MVIKLDENYTIEKDVASWNLRYSKVQMKNGKPTASRDMTFHPNLEYALQWYADKVLGDCESINEVLDKIRETKELIRTVVAPQIRDMEKGK